ncbi:MAG: 2Fe-2S iron-sulfur cluster-binding protein [Flavobacteriales bacterium]|jgi:ring-1,2-phenylacetyl-CoA epoxidase subunit PaaE|nr:2Fe-2S iron-sulfur cluster-binding protein [Flavobacteriales bacterium]
MARKNLLKVSEVRRETADTVSILLDVPEHLKDLYQYKQGQYITFVKEINGEELRRAYSICEAPSSGLLRVAIKEIPNGKFSTYANREMKSGELIDVMTPMGNFTAEVEAGFAKKYVFFAAGSGITPIISNIKTVLEIDSESRVVLLYGNKNSESVIFREQLEDLKSQYMTRLEVYYIMSKDFDTPQSLQGRIDVEKCINFNKISPLTGADDYFLCGPEEMILNVSQWLKEQGTEESSIHFELFNTGVKKAENTDDSKPLAEGTAQVNVVVDGVTVSFDLEKNGENIMDAALEAGADVPFACKGGVCCTCRAKVLEGEVEMKVNYSLQPDEVENGFVLSCQAHPVSDQVTLDFDYI